MNEKTGIAATTEELVLPEIEKYLSRKTFPEIELPKIFNRDDRLVIFDIGACEGEDSIRYARLFPNSRIFTFEPLPENQSLVQKNFLRYGIQNASLEAYALCDRNGESDFFVSSCKPPHLWEGEEWNYGNKSSSLLKPEPNASVDWLEFKKKITVRCRKMVSFCDENQIKQINFIHLDVQGAELLVLKGASNLLCKIDCIWMEVGEKPEYRGQALRAEVDKYMQENGFCLVHFQTDGQWGDQFWVNPRNPKVQWILFKKRIRDAAKKIRKFLSLRK